MRAGTGLVSLSPLHGRLSVGVCAHKALGQVLNQPGPLPVNYSVVEKELRTGEPSRPSWWAGVVLKIDPFPPQTPHLRAHRDLCALLKNSLLPAVTSCLYFILPQYFLSLNPPGNGKGGVGDGGALAALTPPCSPGPILPGTSDNVSWHLPPERNILSLSSSPR